MLAVCASADGRPKRTGAAIPPNIHARIIQLEDERNLNGDELTGLLKHRSAAVRERAALAIGRIGDKRGTDALIAVLEHEGSEPARAMAAFALGEMEDARGVSVLMAVVEREKESLSVRARAVEALGKIAGVQANVDALGKNAVERINQSLAAQLPDSQTPLEQKPLTSLTIAALMRIRSPASVEPLVRQLKSKDAEIRAQAANALARLRQPIDAAVPALIEALNDGDVDVRANAARALGASKDERAVEPLLKLLDDESERAEVNAVRALAALGDQRAEGPLIELGEILMWGPRYARLRDDETLNLLLEVATALGTIKGERAWVFLAQLHHDFASKSVREVEVAIAKFAGREFPEATTIFADQRDTFCRCEINTRPYARGAVGMALSGKDTGGSQFFITHSPQPHLEGGYTVFGQVVGGLAVVDRIARGDVIRRVEIFEGREGHYLIECAHLSIIFAPCGAIFAVIVGGDARFSR